MNVRRQHQQLCIALALAAASAAPASAAITTLVPLGNLFGDSIATPIATAVATDPYGQTPLETELGIELFYDNKDVAHKVNLGAPQTIAPGVTFNYSNVGGANAYAREIFNDAWQPGFPLSTTGSTAATSAGPKIEDGIGMHANGLITFNLDELRAAGAPDTAALFLAHLDQNDDQATNGAFRGTVIVSDANGNVLAGYINGQKVAVTQTAGVWAFSGTIPGELTGAGSNAKDFSVGLASNAKYLTLAVTSTDISADHAAWSGARIDYAPKIELDNLFDDSNTTSLWTALSTDTYKANAETADLGVDTIQLGNLHTDTNVNTSGVKFNFTSAGATTSGTTSSNGPANDSIGSDPTSRPPLRLDGNATGFPAQANWPTTELEEGIGMHANSYLTFDLDEIRTAGDLGNAQFRFTALAGLNDSAVSAGSIRTALLLSDASGVLAGYINGQLVSIIQSGGTWSFNGVIPAEINSGSTLKSNPYDVIIGSNVRYLTLVALGGTNINSDHVAWVDAQLTTLIPAPAALPAGLALMGLLTMRRR
ncbi:MAG: hypothetical protein GC162_12310 [Planctomycetes bacterium]|nr:hypothetical protein [Planctomycetota bacterium]